MVLSLVRIISSRMRTRGGEETTPSWAPGVGAPAPLGEPGEPPEAAPPARARPAATDEVDSPSSLANAWPAAVSGAEERGDGLSSCLGLIRPPSSINAVTRAV